MGSMNTKKKSSNVPTRKEIIQAAADLVPVLRERAESVTLVEVESGKGVTFDD